MESLLLLLYFSLTLFCFGLTLLLVWATWQRTEIQAARVLSLCLLALAEIIFSFLALALSNTDIEGFFWARLRFLGLSFVPLFYFYFALSYTTWHLSKWLLISLSIIPLLTQIIIWTDFLRPFFILDWQLLDLGILSSDVTVFGAWFFVHSRFSEIILIIAMARIGYYAWTQDKRRRIAAGIIILATTIALVIATPPFNQPIASLPKMTPIGLSIMGMGISFAVFRHKFLRLNPIAYELVLENLGEAFFLLDKSKRIVDVNNVAENLLHKTRQELYLQDIGTVLSDIFPFEADSQSRVFDLQSAEGTKVYEARSLELVKRGRWIALLLSIRDISIYRQAEDQAIALKFEQERVRLLSEFITNTSHDLGSPLSVINSSLYILENSQDSQRKEAAIRRIGEQSKRIENILRQFHLLSSLDKSSDYPQNLLRLETLMEIIVANIRPLAEQAGISFTYRYMSQKTIIGNEILLKKAAEALLDNAILYNQKGGKIWLDVYNDETCVYIEVRDTGQGIAEEKLPHVFDSFFKSNEARTLDGSGAGIGLALVKRIVNMHSGQIKLESALGKGTSAKLSFPIAQIGE